ncbi:unnamed protein product [Amoebophrya sp. A25]|nr:unnamed protein product [Amoebophrya sp. A25]|eukprot:GSA25T00027116001.1
MVKKRQRSTSGSAEPVEKSSTAKSLAAKLRKLYNDVPTDSTSALDAMDDDGVDGESGDVKKAREDASRSAHLSTKLENAGRLRLRADIPMLVEGKKMSRKELEDSREEVGEDAEDSKDEDMSAEEVDGDSDDESEEDAANQENDALSEGEDESSSDDAPVEIRNDKIGMTSEPKGDKGNGEEAASEDDDEEGSEENASDVGNDEDDSEEAASKPKAKKKTALAIDADLERQYQLEIRGRDAKKREQDYSANAGASASSSLSGVVVRKQLELYKKLQKMRIMLEPALRRVADAEKDEEDADDCIDKSSTSNKASHFSPAALRGLRSALRDLQAATVPDGWASSMEEQPVNHVSSATDAITTAALNTLEQTRQKTQVAVRNERAFKVLDQSIPAQIEAALEDEHWRKKVALHRASQPSSTFDNTTVYDDREFYAAMLGEIVHGNGLSSSASRDGTDATDGTSTNKTNKSLASRVQLLQSKKNPDCDRRASKGRKIRYVAIEKLQNFMVPRPLENAMDEDLVDQMMNSLFR